MLINFLYSWDGQKTGSFPWWLWVTTTATHFQVFLSPVSHEVMSSLNMYLSTFLMIKLLLLSCKAHRVFHELMLAIICLYFLLVHISSINLHSECIEPLTKTVFDKAVGNSYWGGLAWCDFSEGLARVSAVEGTKADACSPYTGTRRSWPAIGKLENWFDMLPMFPVSSIQVYSCSSMSLYFVLFFSCALPFSLPLICHGYIN